MSPSRAASITAAVVWGIVALLLWSATADGTAGSDDRIQQFVAVAGLLGTPLAIAGAVLAYGSARAARGRDLPERIVALATAGLRTPRDAWGAGMRAELANIDDPTERRRFAVGCTVTAFRIGTGRGPWLVALGVGVVFAIGTFAASRATLAGGRAGIVGPTITWPPLCPSQPPSSQLWLSRARSAPASYPGSSHCSRGSSGCSPSRWQKPAIGTTWRGSI